MAVTFYFSLKYKFEKGNGWWNSIKNQWWPNVIEGEAASIGQLPLMSITTLISKTKFILLLPFCWQVFTDISKGLFRSVCAHAQSLQLCPTLCDPHGCSPPGSSVHGILQERILVSAAMPHSRGSSWPRDRTCSSCIGSRFFTTTSTTKNTTTIFF